jgi:acyl-coenzyme A synthetase/AMP-(fatty) acid ligase/L-amino acid N-acyltransferase YncA/acyl carrier protein
MSVRHEHAGGPVTEWMVDEQDVSDRTPLASVVTELERQVDTGPACDAVRRADAEGRGGISFAQLDMWANAIAWDLIEKRGSKPEPVPLAVCTPELMLAAALGTLKAGKFYVAVNPMHPAPHVQRILDELDASLLICDHRGRHMARHGLPVRSVEEIVAVGSSHGRPGLRFDDRRLAYVMYTSGSTGRPRGVAQSRRDMLHNVARHRPLAVGREDCVTLISADGFVAAVSNPYVALLGGAALAPYSFKDQGVDGMMGWLRTVGATVLYVFPSFLRQLAASERSEAHTGLRLAYVGGETVLRSDLTAVRRLFPAAEVSVGLNSSETGLTCLHLIPPGSALPDPVPVGRPVLDVEVAVLGESGTPLPFGCSGEIEIRSDYVRPRYWGNGALHKDDAPAPAFRTGDCGRIDADGVVYHLGRVDGMVKIRGFRVDTAYVEAAISAIDGVAEVAVLAVGEDPSAVELIACIVGQGAAGIDPVAVRGAVARQLPPAMIPRRVVIVDALPRTLNGKLDRKSLVQLVGAPGQAVTSAITTANGSGGTPHRLTETRQWASVESRIAEIWSSALGLDEVTVEDDFFALGGTSIRAVSVVAQVRSELGVLVPLAVLFETPTIGAMATAVTQLRGESALNDDRQDRHIVLRPVGEGDFPGICALVNHYIASTTFSFRTELQRPEEWIAEWSAMRTRYPWLVATVDGRVAGVAYAGSWKDRPAYDWSAEVTVYVAHDARRTGVGRALYARLLELLDGQGYCTEVAVIALPNESSVAFHEALGFRYAGVLTGIGYKHGEWLDVGLWQRRNPRRGDPPVQILAVPEW